MRDNFLRRFMTGVTLIVFTVLNVMHSSAQSIVSQPVTIISVYNQAILKGLQIYSEILPLSRPKLSMFKVGKFFEIPSLPFCSFS